MIISSFLRSGASSSNIVGQVEFLNLLLIVTLIVTLLSRRLHVLLPRWKEKLVRAEADEALPTQA